MGNDVSLNKVQKDFEIGKKSQILFSELMTLNGYRCYSADSFQDKYEHWDVLTVIGDGDDKKFERFDIKGLKDCVKEGFEWIELQTIDGRNGWLYSEYMDTLAFEIEDCFLFINRAKLVPIIEKNVELEDIRAGEKIIYVLKDGLQYYQRYQRSLWNKKDITVKSPFKDFEDLIFMKLYKKDGKLERNTPKSI